MTTSFSRTVIFFLTLTVCVLCQAKEILLTSANGIDVYVDDSTVKRSGDLARVWVTFSLSVPERRMNGETYLSFKTLREIDCTLERYRFLFISHHSEPLGRGRILSSETTESDKFSYTAPGTLNHAVIKYACTQK